MMLFSLGELTADDFFAERLRLPWRLLGYP